MNERATWMANDKAPMPGRRGGGTLVEVMIGIVIIGILAVTGAMYLEEGRKTLAVQRHKTTALYVASGRLEALRTTGFAALTNKVAMDYALHDVKLSGGEWGSGADETVTISGMSMPIRTTLQYVNLVSGYDALKAHAEVGYRPDQPDRASVDTLIAP